MVAISFPICGRVVGNGRQGLAIITEGLLTYFDDETMEALWARLAEVLRPFPTGVYLADFRIARPQRGVAERVFSIIEAAPPQS